MAVAGASAAARDLSFAGLGVPTGATGIVPSTISNDGTTVAGTIVRSSGTAAFRWRSDTGVTDLGTLAGTAALSRGYSVSADGSVVYGTSGNVEKVFRWTQAGGMSDTGIPPRCLPIGTSADGSVLAVLRDSYGFYRWTA